MEIAVQGPYAFWFHWHGHGTQRIFAASSFALGWGINDNGQVAGSFTDAASPSGGHGFLYTPSLFTTLDATPVVTGSNPSFTAAFGLNSGGQVVGSFHDSSSATHGFLAIP